LFFSRDSILFCIYDDHSVILFMARAADFAVPLASRSLLSLLGEFISTLFLSRVRNSLSSWFRRKSRFIRELRCCVTLGQLLIIRQELVGRFAKESRNAGGLCPFSDLKLVRRPTHSALPMAPLPSISEIPFSSIPRLLLS
jgi:hypothetical protein